MRTTHVFLAGRHPDTQLPPAVYVNALLAQPNARGSHFNLEGKSPARNAPASTLVFLTPTISGTPHERVCDAEEGASCVQVRRSRLDGRSGIGPSAFADFIHGSSKSQFLYVEPA